MSEPISTTEVENTLTAIFEKIDTVEKTVGQLDTKIDGVNSVADRALSVARAAKEMAKDIKTVPTNGYDVFITVFKKTAGLAALGIVTWGIVKIYTACDKKAGKN